MAGDVDKMKIAWRYEGLSQVESSFGSTTSFGHHFDLSKHIDAETIKACNVSYCKLDIDNGKCNGKLHIVIYILFLYLSYEISQS